MKNKHIALLIATILILDQAIKIYIKTHYFLGEERFVLGKWFSLHFVENEGMAWGLLFGGSYGKIILTLFRLVAVIWGTFYLRTLVRKNTKTIYLLCGALIYAGAAGNLIDSMFYGLIFDASHEYPGGVAHLFPAGGGYTSFLHGKVVDMFYFPVVDTVWPSWMPFWGGQSFKFFEYVFNLADASISVGVFLLLFHELFLKKGEKKTEEATAAAR